VPAVQVFAVDDTSAQLVWRGAHAGTVTITSTGTDGGPPVECPTEAGPGSAVVDGLPPGRTTTLEVTLPGAPPEPVAVTTTAALPGPGRARVATISDLHLGLHTFGYLKTIRERGEVPPPHGDPPSVRCARAALAEAVAWGADLIVVKGDLTDRGRRDEWDQAAALLTGLDVPVVVIPGNHDVYRDAEIDPVEAGRLHGLHVVEDVEHIDLPALRVVLAVTARRGRSRGELQADRAATVADVAAGGPAALVTLHHHLAPRPEAPFWPPGLSRAEGDRFLDGLAATQPRSLVTSGHTHRHRRRAYGPITLTTVGSTKDYPGTWAGYVAHDAGLRQIVRRVAAPDCLRWTEATRRGAARQWSRLSEGRLQDRCFALRWSAETG
jgi:3',5'-cyclic AMP phosphodiesterase CpdA